MPRNIPRAKRAAPAVARGVRHSCRGHQTQTEGRGGTETTCEGRLGERVSCEWGEWRSWQAAFKQRRLRAVLRGQAARLMRRVSWSRVAQIGFASTYGTVYVESRRCCQSAFLCIKVSVRPSPRFREEEPSAAASLFIFRRGSRRCGLRGRVPRACRSPM